MAAAAVASNHFELAQKLTLVAIIMEKSILERNSLEIGQKMSSKRSDYLVIYLYAEPFYCTFFWIAASTIQAGRKAAPSKKPTKILTAAIAASAVHAARSKYDMTGIF